MTEQGNNGMINNWIGVWAQRFGKMSLIHGLFFLLWTGFIVIPSALGAVDITVLEPGAARVMASGSAGTWFTLGYIFYFLVGILVTGLFAMFYFLLEGYAGVKIKGIWNKVAWTHFILMNIGVVLATWLLMYAGYNGGAMLIAGESYPEVHAFLGPLTLPIGLSILVLVIGVFVGIIFFAVHIKKVTGSWLRSAKEHIETVERARAQPQILPNGSNQDD